MKSGSRTISLEQMPDFAKTFARTLKAGDCVCLSGEMGAGKTTFCHALVTEILQAPVDNFSSPTFSILNQYQVAASDLLVNHVDLYRLESADEFWDLDLAALLQKPNAITLIEWGEKFAELSDLFTQRVYFEYDPKNPEQRVITILR